ncbi:MAG: hypothetical protein PHX83_10230 [Acidobacteriia bacterium]|nr:hypothetical protein [Terriglobia bacterium]
MNDDREFSLAAGDAAQSYPSKSSSQSKVNSSSATATLPDAEVLCDICGGPMVERNCKVICLNCGFRRDCTDP